MYNINNNKINNNNNSNNNNNNNNNSNNNTNNSNNTNTINGNDKKEIIIISQARPLHWQSCCLRSWVLSRKHLELSLSLYDIH